MNNATAKVLLTTLVLLLGGCSNFGYYSQSIRGQLGLMAAREPVATLLQDPATPDELKARLTEIQHMRDFASRELHLPDNGSYRSYVDTGRPYVVWNVFAAPALSIEPVKWCFAIAGCVSYRGYFSEQDARAFAEGLRTQHYDVYVGGVSAYSTLGWFDDPLLDTIIRRPAADIAALIFHELAHQQLYIKDDTVFNESFATTVELEGTRRWLEGQGSAQDHAAYLERRQRRDQFVQVVMSARERLQAVYQSELDDEQKRLAKQGLIKQLQDNYRQLKNQWGGHSGYDRWFAEDLNNAKLASVGAYHEYVPGFQALLARHNGDLHTFYQEAERLTRLPREQRATALRALLGE